jgi:hypothetical protein
MANPNITDIMATTIDSRTKAIADNVTNNNAILKKLESRGNIKTVSGGEQILQELSFAENTNAGWYSGYDLLPVGVSDVISAAEYDWTQYAVPVVISGLEQLKNSGKERMIDLLEGRMNVAESTMANDLSLGLYSDGTAAANKQIDGLDAAIPQDPTLAPYGGIDGGSPTGAFWANQIGTTTQAAIDAEPLVIQSEWNAMWASLVRGMDRPDCILVDNIMWNNYMTSLQAQQRFNSPVTGDAGFASIKFMDADVILDGGIGGAAEAQTAFFLNSKYIHYRPHAQRNMVPLSPNKRYSINQDAEVQIIAWAGNLTTSGRQFQGRYWST